MTGINSEINEELTDETLSDMNMEDWETDNYSLISPKFISQLIIAAMALLLMFGISHYRSGWAGRVRAALHQAINADKHETFGVIAESKVIRQIINNVRNLVRLEEITRQIQTSGMPLEQPVFQNWNWPLNGDITKRFGWEEGGTDKLKRFNPGIEITAPADGKIQAVAAGRIQELRQEADGRWTVVVQHAQGWQSSYTYLGQVEVKVGQWIKAGQILGRLTTKDSSGLARLGFELKKDNRPVDPLTVLVNY